MEIREVEYAIVGVGTAGLGAFSRIRKKTNSVVLIQHGPYGTTCARVGCMPSKMLITAADLAHNIDEGRFFGIDGQYQVNGPRVFERIKEDRAKTFVGGVLKYVNSIPDQFKLEGKAVFVGPDTLEVDSKVQIKADKIILACGSTPYLSPVFEPLRDVLDTSDTIFEIDDLPKSLAVVGLGVIALELGQAFHRLGTSTTLYGRSGRIGSFTHPDMQTEVMKTLQKELDIIPQGNFTAARKVADGIELTYQTASGEEIIKTYERVLVASGRASNLRSMNLEKSNLVLDDRGLPKYDLLTMQCGDSKIFIAGDATEDLPLWHEAYTEGRIAADSAISYPGRKEGTRTAGLGIYFTDPLMAIVGQEYRRLDPDSIVVGRASVGKGPRHEIYHDKRGIIQLYADKQSGVLLGAELFGRGAEHMAHTLVLAIEHRMTVKDILRMPIYHPSLEEVMKAALNQVLFQLK